MSITRDIKNYLCTEDISIFKAMKKIESLGNKGKKAGRSNMFLLIIKKNNFLLGTLTDGDIRRGIINGLSLESSVSECMEKNFITGMIGEDEKNKILLEKISKSSSFLPIIDKNGHVKKVLIKQVGESNI